MQLVLLFFVAGCGSGTTDKDAPEKQEASVGTLQALNQRLEADPSDVSALNDRALYSLSTGDFDDALKDINQALNVDENNATLYLTLSDIQLYMGQTNNCLAAINKAITLEPKSKEARLKLAKLYLIMRNYDKTFQVLQELIQSDPFNPKAYYFRALALLEKGDTARAVGDLMKAVDQDQEYYEAYVQLGELFSLRQDPLAEGYLKNAIRIFPSSTEALYMLGKYYQDNQQFDAAFAVYDSLLAVDATFRTAPYNKGYVYLVYYQDFPEAIDQFTQAIMIDSSYVFAWYNRGLARELNGELQEAYEDYKKVLALDVNNVKAIEGLNRLDKGISLN